MALTFRATRLASDVSKLILPLSLISRMVEKPREGPLRIEQVDKGFMDSLDQFLTGKGRRLRRPLGQTDRRIPPRGRRPTTRDAAADLANRPTMPRAPGGERGGTPPRRDLGKDPNPGPPPHGDAGHAGPLRARTEPRRT